LIRGCRLGLLLHPQRSPRVSGRLRLDHLRGLLGEHRLIRGSRLGLLLHPQHGPRVSGRLRLDRLRDLLSGLSRGRCLGLLLGYEHRLRIRGQGQSCACGVHHLSSRRRGESPRVVNGLSLRRFSGRRRARCGLLLLRLLQSVIGRALL